MSTSHQPETQGNDSRRAEIIAAAAELFNERGFAGASNREIARAAGISPGLIYWYFRDKDELFLHVMEHLFPLHHLEIPSVDAGDRTVEGLLRDTGTRFLSIMTQPNVQRLMRLALSELIRFPDLRRGVGDLMARQAVGKLARELDRLAERGEIASVDTMLASQSFFGAFVGFILRKHLFESPDLAGTTHEEMIEVIVHIHARGLRGDEVITETMGSGK
jgi:AcrR family transcriptional regulator